MRIADTGLRRLRRTIAASLATVCVAAGSTASAQQVNFFGTGVITYFSEDCGGWRAPAIVKVRYRPGGVGSNGPDARMSFFFPTFAAGFRVRGSGIDETFRQAEAGYVGSSAFGDRPVRIRAILQQPANIRPATPALTKRFRILGFDDRDGCNVTLEARLLRQPS